VQPRNVPTALKLSNWRQNFADIATRNSPNNLGITHLSATKKIFFAILFIIVVGIGIFATQVGFYSIQPIGALPEGTTWLIWRAKGEPFFNSADRVCLDRLGRLSLIGRSIALSQAPKDRIVIRLSYWKYAYKQSVDGKEFER
jgi:hypothetical protein